MSAATENRWKQSNSHHKHNPSRSNNSQQQQRNTSGAKGQGSQAQGGNRGGGNRNQNPAGNKGGENKGQPPPPLAAGGNALSTALGVVEEPHVPVRNFNGTETKEFLKKVYQEATQGDQEKKSTWKADGSSSTPKASAWGPKPGAMANNRDFWMHLTKQVARLEQGGGG